MHFLNLDSILKFVLVFFQDRFSKRKHPIFRSNLITFTAKDCWSRCASSLFIYMFTKQCVSYQPEKSNVNMKQGKPVSRVFSVSFNVSILQAKPAASVQSFALSLPRFLFQLMEYIIYAHTLCNILITLKPRNYSRVTDIVCFCHGNQHAFIWYGRQYISHLYT